MSRGIWGELAIVMTWALITIGAALISHAESRIPVAIVGLAYGLMTANILFVNQIPDIDADRKANKLTLAVKVESKNIWKYYLIISSTAYLLMSTAYLLKLIQGNGYLFLALYPASIYVAHELKKSTYDKKILKKCIELTIFLAHLFGIATFI